MPDRTTAEGRTRARRPLLTRLRMSWSGRGPFLRRAASLALALLAGMLAISPQPASEERTGHAGARVGTVATTRDLPPGHVLTRGDLMVAVLPEPAVPKGVQHEPGSLEGRTLGSPVRAGEPLTDARLVGPELTRLSTGDPEHTTVAIRLAEPELTSLLHPGRRVDLVAATERSVLAENVPVIALPPSGADRDPEQLVMVGLPRTQAATVAAISVTQPLTVTLR